MHNPTVERTNAALIVRCRRSPRNVRRLSVRYSTFSRQRKIGFELQRSVAFSLRNVPTIPRSLRAEAPFNSPAVETSINLAQLFQQYYHDSYPAGPPNPDPANFEYLTLVSPAPDFRFLDHVLRASRVKRQSISTDLGQAFCRQILHDHFGIVYFAHMSDVLERPTHPAFGGLRIRRIAKGDVPDYLCARKVTEPLIAEAKGRFSSIGFDTAAWASWRQQFTRIAIEASTGEHRRAKGYIVATRFIADSAAAARRTTVFLEDPDVPGLSELAEEERLDLGTMVLALHYSRVFSKLDLPLIAASLGLGFNLPDQLNFQLPVWTCLTPPFQGKEFIGGFYRTREGATPSLTEKGWSPPVELGRGQLTFVGLSLDVARVVMSAARGSWRMLARVEPPQPEGLVGSEFAWLLDGSVCTPIEFFIPTGNVSL